MYKYSHSICTAKAPLISPAPVIQGLSRRTLFHCLFVGFSKNLYRQCTPNVCYPSSAIKSLGDCLLYNCCLGIILIFRFGATSAIAFPCYQRSIQNLVSSPLPMTVSNYTPNSTWALCGTLIGKAANGLLASAFCSHSQCMHKDHPMISKIYLPKPKPPYWRGCPTCSQETRQ